MPENKIFRDFLENTYDSKENYNSIYLRIEEKNEINNKLLNLVAVILIVLVTGLVTKEIDSNLAGNVSNKIYKENVSEKAIQLDSGDNWECHEKIDMDYIYQDKIGIKIESIKLTSNDLHIDLDIKLDEKLEINDKLVRYGFAIYDENNNIYMTNESFNSDISEDYCKKIYEELERKYDTFKKECNNELASSTQYSLSEINLCADSIKHKKFPQSKKLYIRIFDIGYISLNSNEYYINLSEKEWKFEIDIPEKYYDTEVNNKKTGKFIKTYQVYNIAESMTGEYLYLTIRQYQFDEIETVKVPKKLASSVEVNKPYEFEFEYTDKKIENNIKSIFENANLISIKLTNKYGMDQTQDSI